MQAFKFLAHSGILLGFKLRHEIGVTFFSSNKTWRIEINILLLSFENPTARYPEVNTMKMPENIKLIHTRA